MQITKNQIITITFFLNKQHNGAKLLPFAETQQKNYLLSLNLPLMSSHPNYHTVLEKIQEAQDNHILTQLFHSDKNN